MPEKQSEKKQFRNKMLVPTAYAIMLGLGIWGASGLIPSNTTSSSNFAAIEPAAGQEASSMDGASVEMNPHIIPAINEDELINATAPASGTTMTEITAENGEMAPLRISPDKPEIVTLDRSAVNVLVGNDEQLRAVPDTNRTIILIPKKPGATYFKALDANGEVIMQRHVIIGGPKNEYIRIRRACANGEDGCKEFSVYYCPDACHEVDVMQDAKESAPAPSETPSTMTVSPTKQLDDSAATSE